jgi:hypothetical protein
MTRICVAHNAICYDEVNWSYPKKDVTELVRIAQSPTFITKCPKCLLEVNKKMEFLRGWNGQEKA